MHSLFIQSGIDICFMDDFCNLRFPFRLGNVYYGTPVGYAEWEAAWAFAH